MRYNTARYVGRQIGMYGDLAVSNATGGFVGAINSGGRIHVVRAGRYANVDRHLAAHQKPLILIRLSDYSAAVATMEMFHVLEVIRPV